MEKLSGSARWFSSLFKTTDAESTYMHRGEILVVFLIGYLIALSLWLLVNLGREYTLNLSIPLEITGYNEELSYTESPPNRAVIGVAGEGWNLLSLYRNPPEVVIPYGNRDVNIADMVQSHLNTYPELTLQKVEPPVVSIRMEPRISRRIPVQPRLDVRLKSQFEIIGDISVRPDSVTITGAESIVDTLQFWPTNIMRLRDVQNRVVQRVALAETGPLLNSDSSEVEVTFDITEFTEGEVRIYVRTRNVPSGRQLRLNPTVLTVRYNVPIEHFSQAQEIVPYEAFVDYNQIEGDTTGFVEPAVRSTADELNLRLRSFQPRRLSYFRVIEE